MSDQPPADQDSPGLLAVLSLAGVAVLAWSCVLAWAMVQVALHLIRWLA